MIEMKEKSAIKLDWTETLAVAEERLTSLIPPGYNLEVRSPNKDGVRVMIGLHTGYFDEADLDAIYEGVGANHADVTSTERGNDVIDCLSESLTLRILTPAIPLKIEEVYANENGICFMGKKK